MVTHRNWLTVVTVLLKSEKLSSMGYVVTTTRWQDVRSREPDSTEQPKRAASQGLRKNFSVSQTGLEGAVRVTTTTTKRCLRSL